MAIPPPERKPPDSAWEHYSLWEKLQEALHELPSRFESEIRISGINAVEIFMLGQVLSSAIEKSVIHTLNTMRDFWDPTGKYEAYEFIRQSEAFPDVLLKYRFGSIDSKPRFGPIIIGIELKSWYLLAKEGEPSFRFTITPEACANQDLLFIVPWVLSDVGAGTPRVFQPYIELARYVAEYRNYWWQHLRRAKKDTTIIFPSGAHPYPPSREEIVDRPVANGGRNFGRIARTELIDDYVRAFDDMILQGRQLRSWREFFKSGGKAQT